MKKIVWQEFKRNGELTVKRKSFATSTAAEKFMQKIVEKDNFYTVLATR